MADHLRSCIRWCKERGITDAVNKNGRHVLPVGNADFVAKYADGVPSRLQHIITSQHDKVLYAELKQSMPPSDKVRLECCTHLYAGLWLTCSTGGEFFLDDLEFRIAVCLRTGVVPYVFDPSGPPIPCPSAGKSRNAVCNAVDMRSDWFHRIHCIFENKIGRDRMHNRILAKLLQLADRCLLVAHREPKGYNTIDENGRPTDKKRPDGIIYFADNQHGLLFDVATVDPIGKTALQRNKHDSHAYSQEAANGKMKDYKHIAAKKKCDLQPFIVTTLGGFHQTAIDLVNKILRTSKASNKNEIFYRYLSQISCAIMRDNAAIVQTAHRRA